MCAYAVAIMYAPPPPPRNGRAIDASRSTPSRATPRPGARSNARYGASHIPTYSATSVPATNTTIARRDHSPTTIPSIPTYAIAENAVIGDAHSSASLRNFPGERSAFG